MKKILLFLLTLMVLVAPQVIQAQETLTVYDGEATNSYVPVYGYYADAYNKCEMIMSADELSEMNGGTISKMTWYLSTPAAAAWTGTFQVFLMEVNDASISAYYGPNDATVVYEGQLDGTQSTMTIEFTDNYTYEGGNLLVGVYQTVKGNYKSATFAGETVTGASGQGYNSSSLDAVTFTQRNFIPKTTFTYTPGEGDYCPKPRNVAANNITAHTAVVTWDYLAEAEDGYKYYYWKASEEEPSIVETTTDNTVTLTGLDPETMNIFKI